MPFYIVTEEGQEKPRMIKAKSSAAAVDHCVKDRFKTETITMIDEAAPYFEQGVKLEKAEGE
jgi:hypothetical protein